MTDDFELTMLDARPAARRRYEALLNTAIQCDVKLYMNLSASSRELKLWVEQLACAYQMGELGEALVLIRARPDTTYFRRLAHFHLPACFIHGRLTFDGYRGSANFPSVVFYLGSRAAMFVQAFDSLGWVGRCIRDDCGVRSAEGVR